MDRLEEKMSIAARSSRDARVERAPILGAPLDGVLECKSCGEYPLPARYIAYPAQIGGGHAKEPWPLCLSHMPFAFVAGWKVVEAPPAENSAPGDTGSERSEHRDAQTNTSLHSEEKEETR